MRHARITSRHCWNGALKCLLPRAASQEPAEQGTMPTTTAYIASVSFLDLSASFKQVSLAGAGQFIFLPGRFDLEKPSFELDNYSMQQVTLTPENDERVKNIQMS